MDITQLLGKLGHIALEARTAVTSSDWAHVALRFEALTKNKTVHTSNYSGAVEKNNFKDFLALVEQLKNQYHMIETNERNVPDYSNISGVMINRGRVEFTSIFLGSEIVFSVIFSGKEASINVQGLSKEEVTHIVELFSPIMKKKHQRKGRACTVLKESEIYISDLGPAGKPLIRDNYEQNVVEDFDFLVKDLNDKEPYGRLVILDGPPGTGKTYFIRGLIDNVDNSVFVIVPSSLVAHISDPSFMPAIINLHEEEKVPIVLILEDADTALLPRGADNMSKISDLLNFADGIVGSIIDFRIVATTNAKRIEIEPALLRKGRLSRNTNISALTVEKAKNVYKRLTPDLSEDVKNKTLASIDRPTILANVYNLARVNNEKYGNKK